MTRCVHCSSILVCLAIPLFQMAPAIADAAEPQQFQDGLVLEEVVVTAQKREQSLRDVPISIAVFSGEFIDEAGFLELEDLSAVVPGFTVAEAAISTLVFMRGIGSGINQGFEQSVGMYVDGVYAGRGRQFRDGFLDLERVEILRGPQGILFGKNTIAGAINITTAKPTDEFEARLAALGDFNFGEYQVSGMVSGPLTEDLSARVAVRGGGMDGWMFNTALNREEAAVDDIVARASLNWNPTEQLNIAFKAQYSSYTVNGRTTQITDQGSFGPLYLAYDPLFEDQLNTQKSVAGIGQDYSDTENELAVLTINYDWDSLALTAITAWSGYSYLDELDVDFSPVPYLFQTEPQDFSQLSQELRFSSVSDGQFMWLAGIYLETADLDLQKSVDASLGPLGLPLPPATRQVPFNQDAESFALFGQVIWDFADRWRLSAGIRYTYEEKSATQSLWYTDYQTMTPNPALGAIYAQVGLGVPHAFDQSRDDSQWTPQLSLQFDATDAVRLYGSAAQGFKAGGFNEAEVTGDPENFPFDSETSTAFELGAKTRLADGAARLDLALFHTTYEDLQVSTFQGVSFIVGNAAKATSKGIELEGDWIINEWVTLSGSWTWLDSTYDVFPDAACTAEQTQESGQGAACTQNLAGRPTLYAPENSGRLALSWQNRVGGGHLLSAQVDIVHSDGFYIEQDLDPAEFQSTFQKFNLRLGWNSPGDAWSVALLARNLTDEITRHHGSDTPLLVGAHYSTTDRPRSFAVQLSRNF